MNSRLLCSLTFALAVLVVGAQPLSAQDHDKKDHDEKADHGDKHEGGHEIDLISSALLPLPEAYRDGATVLGYGEDGMVSVVREGNNGMFCLADKPGDERFQAVCYHESLEPFMARGRELRAQGVKGREVLEKRHEEVNEGLLQAPAQGAVLYNMMMDLSEFNPETATPALYAIYAPYATEESTGLSSQPPAPGGPWLMRAGTPSAHIMIVIPDKHDH